MARGKRPSIAHLWVPPCARQRPPGGRWSKAAAENEEPGEKPDEKTEEKADEKADEKTEEKADEEKAAEEKTEEQVSGPGSDSEEDRPLAQR